MWWSEASTVEMSRFVFATYSRESSCCTLGHFRGCVDILCLIAAFVAVPGKYTLTGSWDKSLCLCNLDNGVCHRMHGHDGPVVRAAGRIRYLRALSAAGNCMKLWELQHRQCLKSLELLCVIIDFSVDWKESRMLIALSGGRLELRSSDELTLQHAWNENFSFTQVFANWKESKGLTFGYVLSKNSFGSQSRF